MAFSIRLMGSRIVLYIPLFLIFYPRKSTDNTGNNTRSGESHNISHICMNFIFPNTIYHIVYVYNYYAIIDYCWNNHYIPRDATVNTCKVLFFTPLVFTVHKLLNAQINEFVIFTSLALNITSQSILAVLLDFFMDTETLAIYHKSQVDLSFLIWAIK